MQKVYRNWGYYITLINLPFLKIKYLKFDGSLSFQKHKLRSEFWIKLKGNGKFYLNGKFSNNNLFFYIPKKVIHSFSGHANFIEFQFGVNIENDIKRISNLKW